MSLLATEKMTAQVQESILKDAIRWIQTVSDITQGHSPPGDAYLAMLATLHKLSLIEPRSLDAMDLLRPTEERAASLVLREKEDSGWMFTLRVEGNFLPNVQLGATANSFTNLPFTGASRVQVPDNCIK